MNNHNLNKYKTNTHSPQTKNYSTLFSTASKTWPSGPECWPRKYGWFSSGLDKLVFIPLLNLHFLQGRRSSPLGQPLISELNHHSIHGRRSRALAQALPTLNGRWYSSTQKPAFTIIEVVLVLAIAGLIFLMVFVALPALQRNQRDTQRKNDMAKIADAHNRCLANARGRHCDVWTLITGNYLNMEEWKDPSTGASYRVVGSDGSAVSVYSDPSEWSIGTVYWNNVAKCVDNRPTDIPNDSYSKTFVAATKLEGGGIICISNFNE